MKALRIITVNYSNFFGNEISIIVIRFHVNVPNHHKSFCNTTVSQKYFTIMMTCGRNTKVIVEDYDSHKNEVHVLFDAHKSCDQRDTLHFSKSSQRSFIILCTCSMSLTPHIIIFPVEKTLTERGLYLRIRTAGKISGSKCT